MSCDRLGLPSRVAWTPEERSALVAAGGAATRDCRCLVAAGGDGTVAALVNERPDRADHRPAGRDREPLSPATSA